MGERSERTRLERLNALRDAQEAAFAEGVAPREFAALSREYRATLAEIATLTPAVPKGDAIDQLAQRRTARGAGTAQSRRRSAANEG